MRRLVLGVLLTSPLMIGCARYHATPIHAPELETAYGARTVDNAQLRSFVEVGVGTALSRWPPRALDLKTLIFIGYYYSTDLDVARAQLDVAEAGIRAAGARVNPDLGVNAGYNRNPESHAEYSLVPAFTLETAGKRGYRILRAERMADAARVGLSEAGWMLRSRIRAALVNHWLATERLDVLRTEQSVRAEIVEIFDRRLAVGEAARPELDVYRVDLITTDAAVRVATGDVAQTRAALANAVGVPLAAGEGDRLSLATVRLQTVTAARARLDALTRAQTALGVLEEPIKMEETLLTTMLPVRFESRCVLLVAGIAKRYTCETSAGIPSQWQRFLSQIGSIPGQAGTTAFGVRYNNDDDGTFDYLCGVEVSDFSSLPSDLTPVRIAAQKYAVFVHRGHISTIRSAWNTIWNKWLPESGHEVVDAPDFERYGEEFDPRTGAGGLELWVPIKA